MDQVKFFRTTRYFGALSLLIASCITAPTAQALSLSFLEPNGTVGPNDTIPIIVRITNNTGEAFNFDGNDPLNSYGIPGIQVPTEGIDDFGNEMSFDGDPTATFNFTFTCSGSFTAGGTPPGPCSPGDEYEFDFSTDQAPFFADTFTLQDGANFDFQFGEFIPLAGGAAPGTYDFFRVSLFLDLFGFTIDDMGNFIQLNNFIDLGETCTSGDTTCAFSRTVAISPVPLPAAAWFFLTAVGGLFGARRFRGA